MKKSNILPVVEDILNGRTNVILGAKKLNISKEEMNSYIRLYSLYGKKALSPSLIDKTLEIIGEKLYEYKLLFNSHLSIQKMKLKIVYSLFSFLLVSIGILMFTFSASIFPKFMFAAERDNNFSKMRLISNMEFKNSKSVSRQLKRASSVYDRMAKVLKENGESPNSELMRIINSRRRNIDEIKTEYIKKGRKIKKNLSLKYRDGEIYERILEALPQYDIKNNSEFAQEILKRVQTSEKKLAVIKKFYKSTLRKGVNHYSKIIRKIEKIERKEKVSKTRIKRKKSAKKILSDMLIRTLYEDIKKRTITHRHNIKRYEKNSKMAVISKYNKENQIIRKLSDKNLTSLRLKI